MLAVLSISPPCPGPSVPGMQLNSGNLQTRFGGGGQLGWGPDLADHKPCHWYNSRAFYSVLDYFRLVNKCADADVSSCRSEYSDRSDLMFNIPG